jgi:hypothetical protein
MGLMLYREIQFLYDDEIPWKELGKMQCVRASDVVFESERQKWFVQLKPPVKGVWRIGPFDSRVEAIGEEIKFLESSMENGKCSTSACKSQMETRNKE